MSILYVTSKLVADLNLDYLPHVPASTDKVQVVVSVITAVMAAIAVLIIVISGFRYILSRGDAQAVSQSKNAILYALVGLVVIMAAFSIVTFVLSRL